MEHSVPNLIEPGVQSFLYKSLNHCHEFKTKYYNIIFNISILIVLIIVISLILLYKYKGKLTENELEEKDMLKKQYILSKIQNFQLDKLRAEQRLITGLPQWDTNI